MAGTVTPKRLLGLYNAGWVRVLQLSEKGKTRYQLAHPQRKRRNFMTVTLDG